MVGGVPSTNNQWANLCTNLGKHIYAAASTDAEHENSVWHR